MRRRVGQRAVRPDRRALFHHVRRIDELAKRNYLRKSVDPIDKRRINVEIAGPSLAVVERFLGKLGGSIRGLLEGSGTVPG
jgi:hypothetical protein